MKDTVWCKTPISSQSLTPNGFFIEDFWHPLTDWVFQENIPHS